MGSDYPKLTNSLEVIDAALHNMTNETGHLQLLVSLKPKYRNRFQTETDLRLFFLIVFY